MSRPAAGAVAERLYDRLEIYSPGDDTRGWPLLVYLEGLGRISQMLDDVVRDQADGTPGLAAFMDPDRTQAWALAWLAMFAGVRLPRDLPELAQREALKQTPSQDRGTRAAIIGAARQQLTDPVNGYVALLGFVDGDVYKAELVTRAAQTPDPAAVVRALPAVKPAGLRLTHIVSDLEVWNEAAVGGATWNSVPGGVTWNDMATSTI